MSHLDQTKHDEAHERTPLIYKSPPIVENASHSESSTETWEEDQVTANVRSEEDEPSTITNDVEHVVSPHLAVAILTIGRNTLPSSH
jgi:hypothetical protein